MKRTLLQVYRQTRTDTINTTTALRDWLAARAQGLRWLLAHTEAGVIWGEFNAQGLQLSLPLQRALTPTIEVSWPSLLEARLFGSDGEVLLWRGPAGQWQERSFNDSTTGPGDPTRCLDEHYLLWGTRLADQRDGVSVSAQQNGFSLLAEGAQGILHAPPISALPSDRQRAALHVRHYLAGDPASGMRSIVASRLVDVVEP
jgi:CRISPR-associated protein (TIGR03984 family)